MECQRKTAKKHRLKQTDAARAGQPGQKVPWEGNLTQTFQTAAGNTLRDEFPDGVGHAVPEHRKERKEKNQPDVTLKPIKTDRTRQFNRHGNQKRLKKKPEEKRRKEKAPKRRSGIAKEVGPVRVP